MHKRIHKLQTSTTEDNSTKIKGRFIIQTSATVVILDILKGTISVFYGFHYHCNTGAGEVLCLNIIWPYPKVEIASKTLLIKVLI